MKIFTMKRRISVAVLAVVALAALLSPVAAMKLTDIPTKFPVPFGNSATSSFIRVVPQTTTDPCAASLNLGFPPNTFSPIGAGGCPPDGRDFNGILNQTTAWNRWQNAGGPLAYDPTFSAAINGYPKGAILAASTFGNYWLSTADDNTSDPDTGGANWFGFTLGGTGVTPGTYLRPKVTVNANGQISLIASGAYPTRTELNTAGSGTYTPPAGVKRLFVRMMAAGGGGGGTSGGAGTAGTQSIFNSISANGGGGGQTNSGSAPGAGGTGTTAGSGSAYLRRQGGYGMAGIGQGTGTAGSSSPGGSGCGSPFGGAGQGGVTTGLAAQPNTGSGGQGGGTIDGASVVGAGGGACGEYVEIQVTNPLGSISYTVGTKGSGGSGSYAGGNGADGTIIIDEFYD